MDIFDQIEQPSGAVPKGDIFDEVAPRGLTKYSGLLGGENAQIKSAPGFWNNLVGAFTEPFHQERAPIAADEPRPGIVGRTLENVGAVGKGVLGLLNAPFETIAPTVTKYAGENLPIEPRTAEAIGNAAGVVAQGSILPWRSRVPLTPARNIEDLIAAPRPGLPAPAERPALPPATQPRLNPPEMVTQVTPEGVASQAPKRTIIDLVDEVKRDVKQQVIDEIFQELKTGRPQAPKQAAPLSIEDLRGQLAPEARPTVAPSAPAPPMFEQTEAGKQAVIPGAEARTIPQGGLRPKRAQTEAPLDLEQPALRAQEPELPTAAPVENRTYAVHQEGGPPPIFKDYPQLQPKKTPSVQDRITQLEAENAAMREKQPKTFEMPSLKERAEQQYAGWRGYPPKKPPQPTPTPASQLASDQPRTRTIGDAYRAVDARERAERMKDTLVSKMLSENIKDLSDAELKRVFKETVSPESNVKNAKILMERGQLTAADIVPLPGERSAGDIIKGEKGQIDPSKMTAAQINKSLDHLDAASSKFTDEMIAAGRGNERPSDYLNKTDPLSMQAKKQFDERSALQNEIERRYGPGAPSRLPRGTGKILSSEKGAISFGRDKPPEVFGPPIEPPEVRGGIQPPKFDFSKWNDKAALSLSRETLERNISDVAPAADAAKVDKFIVQPVRQNETSRINFNNSLRTETRGAVVEKLGIKAGSKEDALTQAYGEGRLPLAELKTLTPNWQKVVSASDYFRGKYDTLLDTVNAARAKFGYDPIPKRADYFRHFQDINNIIKNFGVILRTEDLPTEISGLTEAFKPGKPFTTAELQRKGGNYTMSAIRGFDNYIDSISKQIFHIDSVQRARGLEKYIREAAGAENAKLPNLVANLHEYGNLLAGKKSTFDRAFESLFGRKFYAAVNVLRGRTSANMVGGNVSSALTNFIPFTQAAATTDKGSLAKGMLQATMAPFEKDPAAIDGIASSFLRRRYPEGPISPTIGEKVKTGANFLFDAVDKFTARSVVGGKYYEGINNGLSPKEAMAAADTYAGKVITDRSLGQLPNLFNIKTLGPVTQFQTEINNMYSFITKDVAALSGSKAKTVKALSEFVLYSYLFNSGFQYATGRRPTIDPIHFLITLAGDGDIKQKLGTLNEDIVSNLPFTGGISGGRLPISAGLPDVAGMIKGEKGVGSELSKPAFFLAPPFGGLQAKKTIEGIGAFNAGQVRSKSGDKKLFDIEQSPENLIRSVLFGKYASPQAREYFDSGQLTPRQKMLKQLGLKDMGKDRAEKRREMLNKLGLER